MQWSRWEHKSDPDVKKEAARLTQGAEVLYVYRNALGGQILIASEASFLGTYKPEVKSG